MPTLGGEAGTKPAVNLTRRRGDAERSTQRRRRKSKPRNAEKAERGGLAPRESPRKLAPISECSRSHASPKALFFVGFRGRRGKPPSGADETTTREQEAQRKFGGAGDADAGRDRDFNLARAGRMAHHQSAAGDVHAVVRD